MNAVTLTSKVNLLNTINDYATSIALGFVRSISKLPWILALVFLVTFGVLYTLLTIIPLFCMRKLIAKATESIIQDIKDLDQRKAMLIHSKIERIRDGMNATLSNGGEFFVLKPVLNEIRKISHQYDRLEKALFQYVYPEQKLTQSQKLKLKDAFVAWQEEDAELINTY